MPRTLDPALAMVLDRANPDVCHFVEVNAPDVGQVLRRGADQFLAAPYLVSQTPPGSITADSSGALSIASTAATLANFPAADDGSVALPKPTPSTSLRGLAWQVDPAFGKAILRTFTALIRRKAGSGRQSDLALQIYKQSVEPFGGVSVGSTTFLRRTWVPLLEHPVVWQNNGNDAPDGPWSANIATATFDLSPFHFEVGSVHGRAETFSLPGEGSWYYFVIEPTEARADDLFYWYRDQTTSRTVAGVGNFLDRWWRRTNERDEFGWFLDPGIPVAAPRATITIEHFAATAQAIYALTLPTVAIPSSVGRVVFERGVPVGASATLELSTAGSGGPWTAVTHGAPVTTKQLTYHARVTMAASADLRSAPRVPAIGIEFRVPVDVTAESIVETIAQEVAVPFLQASIGEGRVQVVRTGIRDYRDPGSDLATLYPSSKLEVDVFLGSRHPLVPREKWLLIDRVYVNNREPTSATEEFGLLSYRKLLKRKIPDRQESTAETRVVTSASTSSVTVSVDLPDIGSGPYSPDDGWYIRVTSSSQPGVETGFVRSIVGSSGTKTMIFDTGLAPLPGTLIAGDVVEIHSASYLQQVLTWEDEDPALIWMEILNVLLGIPVERIGRSDLGRVGRSGLPPTVADRAPGDTATQAKLKVTFATKAAEGADGLIDQLSFIMGGTTVDIGGQIVFRQIYPLRDATGRIVVPAEPVAAVFDARNMAGLGTLSAVEQRIVQLACDYGVDSTAKDTPPALTAVAVDVDALAWLDDQPFDELATAAIPSEIARWCFNSTDAGEYLAGQLTQQVVRAASTGLRVWPWIATEPRPELVIGDRVTVITDQYTDYDPARRIPIRGFWAFTLCLVAIADAGRRFRGFMLGLTDALQIKGGNGTLDVTTDLSDSTEILSVTFKDSVDGAQRTYDIITGAAVATLHVHHRLWPTGTQGDPFDFSQAQDVNDSPELTIVRSDPADGHFRFTLDHPKRGFERPILIVPRRGPPTLAFGDEVWKVVLYPAPQAMTAKITLGVTNAVADISVAVGAGVADWPVVVRIYEGSPDSAPLVTKTLAGPATVDASTDPILNDRPLPLRELQSWWVKLTNIASEEEWFGPEAANRDPLPQGTVTLDHYRAQPVFRMVFDTDTDLIKLTVPDGRTKTYTGGALASSPVLYTVGSTVLDDASTESALGVDEERGPYKVEYQGGGQFVTMFGPSGLLRGVPSNPPTARVRVVKNTVGSTEDVFVQPDSSTPEKLRVYYRDGESNTSPVYGLVVSAGDSTPLYVTAGTEVGPASYFKNIDGTGSPSNKLSAIPLTRDQIKRVSVQIEGEDSGVRSSWIPVALSLLEQPWNESFALDWDDVAGELVATVVAGARCLFEEFQVADNDAFTSPTTHTDTVVDGDTLAFGFALSAAQRGKTWYGRVKANNKADGSGLDSEWQEDSVFVPALFDVQPSTAETVTQGTLTLAVDDPGDVLNPTWTNGSITTPIHFEILDRGVKTVEAPTTSPGGGSTTGTFTKVVTLLDHPIQINAYAHLVDGSTKPLGSWMFDSNKISDVRNATVANAGVNATITVIWDTDAKVGAATARYSLNGGGAWTNVGISAGLLTSFAIARSTVKQTVLLQAQNAIDSQYGNQTTVEVDAYEGDQTASGSIDVATNGLYGFTTNVPPGTASIKWLASTSAPPSDSTVNSSGAAVNTGGATRISVASAGTLAFGDHVFITVVPYLGTGGTGTALKGHSFQGAFLKTTATKFDTYPGSAFTISPQYTNIEIDSATGFLKGLVGAFAVKPQATVGLKISNGVTVTSVSMYGKMTYPGVTGTKIVRVGLDSVSKSTGTATGIGAPTISSSSGAVQLVTVSGLSHTVDSQNNTYQLRAILLDDDGTTTALEVWSATVGYTQNNQNQGT